MAPARRAALASVKAGDAEHAGLWFDRFLADIDSDEAKHKLVDSACSIPVPAGYKRFFERWKQTLETCGASLREGRVDQRMVVGLGAESLIETSIALHRTYGVPIIPGSALKGLASSYAATQLQHEQWLKGQPAHLAMFGSTEIAGYVTFFDALYVPASSDHPLAPDIMTVHHPDYYQSGRTPPADWDSPTPIPFLSCTGRYLFAVTGPLKWVARAYDILGLALSEIGVGGKTSRGYGRITLVTETQKPSASLSPEGGRVRTLVTAIRSLKSPADKGRTGPLLKQWKTLNTDAERKIVAEEWRDAIGKVGLATHPDYAPIEAWLKQSRD
ncbi:MAG: type III-B CRISPR module RAMP protein Cmr6 [Candidatus Xenobia bacterium]